ncbi:MAG: hypothetical protein PWR30_564 [Candidatus Woesearchaeota archaeon]|nr:hypothetical protein [Candidatus Woesearchaeota archaeon]
MDGLVDKIEEYIRNADPKTPRDVLTGNRYLKDELVNDLSRYLNTDPSFAKNLYTSVNKSELKKPYYAILCVYNDREFNDFIENLEELLDKTIEEYNKETNHDSKINTDWFKLTFFAGLWGRISGQKEEAKEPNKELKRDEWTYNPYTIIKEGYNLIHKKNAIKNNKGEYHQKDAKKLPGSQLFRLDSDKKYKIITPQIEEIINLIESERKSAKYEKENLREEISEKLKETSESQERILELLYGKKSINSYKQANSGFYTINTKQQNYTQMPLFPEFKE